MNVTIFGKGNMAAAIAKNFEAAGNAVNYVEHETDATLDEVVVLAVPYPAVDDVISRYKEQLDGKIVVDITNPLNFETWDELVVPADGSAASEIQKKLPNSKVVKGSTQISPEHWTPVKSAVKSLQSCCWLLISQMRKSN